MTTFTTGDTAAALTGTVNADLTGASVEIHLRKPDGTVLTKPGTIGTTSATSSAWSYSWAVGDLDTRGDWKVEVQVTYSDARVQTFGPVGFSVQDELA